MHKILLPSVHFRYFPGIIRAQNDDGPLKCANARVGISGTTAKSRKRKFVPPSHPGLFAVVASSRKRQTKVGSLACFDFLYQNENQAMLFHVDMIYLAKQAKCDVEKTQ